MLRRVVSYDTLIVKGVGLLCWSIGASRGAPQVGLPAQVQRSPPEALSVTRPQTLTFDRHHPLEVEVGKIVEAVIRRLIGAVLLEANDDWQLQHRYMQIDEMAELATPMINPQALAITPQAN